MSEECREVVTRFCPCQRPVHGVVMNARFASGVRAERLRHAKPANQLYHRRNPQQSAWSKYTVV